jgi:hypothetical protein
MRIYDHLREWRWRCNWRAVSGWLLVVFGFGKLRTTFAAMTGDSSSEILMGEAIGAALAMCAGIYLIMQASMKSKS